MKKLFAKIYLFLIDPIDIDLKAMFGIVLIFIALCLCYITCDGQTITRKYDGVNRIRIDNSNANELKPCYVFFPGGGFISQNWAVCNSWSLTAVSQGYVSCKVGYSTTFLFPTAAAANKGISDCVNAVKWIKKNWKVYGIDTNKIYLCGTSAGGFCALGVAYQHKQKVAGVLNGWGGVLQKSYLTNSTVSVYNVSTDIDRTVPLNCGNAFGVPCCGSQVIYDELTRLNVKTDWLVWEGYNHGLAPKDSEYGYRVTTSFLNAVNFLK